MQCGFIGLGMLGARMARQVMGAGHALKVFDLDDAAVEKTCCPRRDGRDICRAGG